MYWGLGEEKLRLREKGKGNGKENRGKNEFLLGDYCLGIEEIRGIKVEETWRST